MITRYNDLAANERTYLAWLRSALAFLAFGFLLERFDLVLKTFAKSFSQVNIVNLSPLGREAGIVVVGLGLCMMVLSTWRFIKTTRLIQSETSETYSIRFVLFMGGIFILIAIFILLYISRILSWA
jgi:putative membrane protein